MGADWNDDVRGDAPRDDLDLRRVDRIVLSYLGAAGIWIAVSGPIASWLATTTGLSLEVLEIAKGLVFVGLTGLVLHRALRRWAYRIRDAARVEREAATRTRQLDQLRSEFLTSISHELRTPLTSVVGYADSIHVLAQARGEHELAQHADRLVVNADRLRQLVLDLLETDALLRGQGQLRARTVDVAALVTRVVEATATPDHTVQYEGERLDAMLDVAKVERVVAMLLHNVVRHTPAGTRVEVRWHTQDGQLRLEVTDDGPGFPALEGGAVFAPFVQGHAAAAQAKPGMGLGLTLVQQYVQLHGGDVEASNRPEGGACVAIRMPLGIAAAVG